MFIRQLKTIACYIVQQLWEVAFLRVLTLASLITSLMATIIIGRSKLKHPIPKELSPRTNVIIFLVKLQCIPLGSLSRLNWQCLALSKEAADATKATVTTLTISKLWAQCPPSDCHKSKTRVNLRLRWTPTITMKNAILMTQWSKTTPVWRTIRTNRWFNKLWAKWII